MGLFWSMVPEGGYQTGYRMRKKHIEEPHRVCLMLLDGHDEPESARLGSLLNRVKAGGEAAAAGDAGACLAAQLVERCYLADGVRTETVRHGRVRGTLFIPEGLCLHGRQT